MASKKTKFFRVAVEGLTADGREISRAEIQQMADTYNPEKYGARVFVEHIRGLAPDGPFRALGDVTALKAEEITEGELKGKLALYAQIAPTDAMIRLVNSGQKIYSSVEIAPSLADSKKAYMVGLGITDSPASLGVEVLKFSAQHPESSPFSARKQKPENLFTEAIESDIEMEPEKAEDPATGFFKTLTDVLAKFAGKSTEQPTATAAPTPAQATSPAQGDAATAVVLSTMAESIQAFARATNAKLDDMEAKHAADRAAFKSALAKINEMLDSTPANYTRRPPATGGTGVALTNC